MKFLVLIILFNLTYSLDRPLSMSKCEKVYDDCRDYDKDSVGGWLISGYSKFTGNDLCLGLFRVCKRNEL